MKKYFVSTMHIIIKEAVSVCIVISFATYVIYSKLSQTALFVKGPYLYTMKPSYTDEILASLARRTWAESMATTAF